jgi:hypothetical protein
MGKVLMPENKPNRRLQLQLRVGRLAKRRMVIGRLGLFRVAIRSAEAVEVETPDVEAGGAQRVAPAAVAEPVGDRQCRGECRAVHIEHRASG